ncbi:MAG: hypothetical protein SH847_17585 [Roseiflexaceae bacterium]|nr:hypothetical protein [Roseiflexaceae bacterium]
MTLLAEPVLAASVADQYDVIDPTDVRAFLASHAHLVPVLEQAPEQIARLFPDAPLLLECHIDPDDNTETLLIRIQTPLDAIAANQQMDHLLEAWYLDLPYAVRRDALVTLW